MSSENGKNICFSLNSGISGAVYLQKMARSIGEALINYRRFLPDLINTSL